MAKTELKISGMGHQALEDAVINAGLIVEKKTHIVNGQKIVSLIGGKVLNYARIKVGTFENLRAGLTLRIDPSMIAPSALSSLMHAVR